MKFLIGSASKKLGDRIARHTNHRIVDCTNFRFPDGELYIHIRENLDGEDVVLIQTTSPDECIIELLLLQQAARSYAIRSLTTIIPYFGYSRQDKVFKQGEALSAKVMVETIQNNSDFFATIDIHAPKSMEWFRIPAVNLSAAPVIAEYMATMNPQVVVAPDKGAINRASEVAELLGVDVDYLEKKRIDGSTVEIRPKNVAVDGKRVLICDDIIATGGTIVEATRQLTTLGAEKVFAACTHGVFSSNALAKLTVCDGVFSTDSIPNDTSLISVYPVIMDYLHNHVGIE